MIRASTLFDLSDFMFYNMIVRKKIINKFTTISNVIINNPKMSLKAKGLLIFMLSKPDTWDFSINGLKSQLKEGRDSLSSTLIELENHFYLKRSQNREGGKFSPYEYILYDLPYTDNPITVKPITENQPQVNTKLSKDYNKVNTKLNYIPKNQKNDFKVGSEINEIEVIDANKLSIIEEIKEKEKSSVKKEKRYSQDIHNCLYNCISFFPEHLHPNSQESWLDTIDKLHRIDKVDFSEIERLTKSAREDNFWSNNFLSLTKLRMKDKQKVPYIVVFDAKFKPKEQTINRQTKETIEKNLKGW